MLIKKPLYHSFPKHESIIPKLRSEIQELLLSRTELKPLVAQPKLGTGLTGLLEALGCLERGSRKSAGLCSTQITGQSKSQTEHLTFTSTWNHPSAQKKGYSVVIFCLFVTWALFRIQRNKVLILPMIPLWSVSDIRCSKLDHYYRT